LYEKALDLIEHWKEVNIDFYFINYSFLSINPLLLRSYFELDNSPKLQTMSRICVLTGKRPISGNNVSHSKRKTKRRFLPNLHTKKFYIPEVDKWVTLKVSSNALRTINKLGLYEYLKKLEMKGVNHGVQL